MTERCIAAFTPSQDRFNGLVPFVNASRLVDGRVRLMVRTAITGEFGVIDLENRDWENFISEIVLRMQGSAGMIGTVKVTLYVTSDELDMEYSLTSNPVDLEAAHKFVEQVLNRPFEKVQKDLSLGDMMTNGRFMTREEISAYIKKQDEDERAGRLDDDEDD